MIKIANGFNTGRNEGAPITDLALRMLKDIENTGQITPRAILLAAVPVP